MIGDRLALNCVREKRSGILTGLRPFRMAGLRRKNLRLKPVPLELYKGHY